MSASRMISTVGISETSTSPLLGSEREQQEEITADLPSSTVGTLLFREPGSPAGSFPHTAWWHCVFHDPYERINFWSHAVPGLVFFLLGLASYAGLVTEAGSWVHNPMGIFCFSATATHWCSAITHIYPDSISLEKLDHCGIVALIIGTPLTAIMAHSEGAFPWDMGIATGAMIVAAFFPPLLRVICFTAGCVAMVVRHLEIVNLNMGVQLALYGSGAIAFLRNGGHNRFPGLQDHHFLHYFVTIACVIHIWYLVQATSA